MQVVVEFAEVGWSRWVHKRYAAELLAFLGGLVYLLQAFLHAHLEETNFDEGLYLLKGLLFAQGVYRPFQPYGVWTNKPPLAFLIPGYAQLLFGAGLRTGRYLSVFFGILALLGLWILARRLGNRWLAAGAVWAFAVSPVIIGIYSIAITQVLVNCMLTWVLVLALGERRPLWQLTLSGALAGLLIFTRHNVIAVVPLLGLYLLWQHGWKAAFLSMTACALIILGGVALYWPNILTLFTTALPGRLAPFLDPYRYPDVSKPFLNFSVAWNGRLLAFFQGLRLEFLPVVGSLMAMLLWPKKSRWKDAATFRVALFLGALYLTLLAMHLWASVLNNYCVFCFLAYLAFFNSVGILLLVVFIQAWETKPGPFRQAVIVLFVLFVSAGIGFSLFEEIGNGLITLNGGHLVRVPSLWEVLSGLGWERKLAKQAASASFGLFAGGVFIFLVYLGRRIVGQAFGLSRQAGKQALSKSKGLLYKIFVFGQLNELSDKIFANFGSALASALLLFGFLFSWALTGSNRANSCGLDVLAAYEENGAHLARVIPPDSLVYWDGGLSVVPLLYIPQVRIFPAQLNQDYAFRIGGDPEQLRKAGLWNEALAQQWKNEADFLLIEEARYNDWKKFLDTGNRFDELPRVPQPVSCQEGSRIRIFKRKK
ncbi:MAG: hypothetical protein Fur0043_17380 [Anaerolineales bacterium]